MRRTSKWIAVLAVALMAAGQAQAVVTSSQGFGDAAVGSFGGINGVGTDSLTLSKAYISIGDLFLEITTDTPGQITVQEDILNDTGIHWTDFHWELGEEVGDVTFLNVDTGGAFGNVSFMGNDTVAWADGGPGVPDGGVLVANITLNIGQGGALFGINQTPTIAEGVPEPVSAVMGMMGLAVLGYATRRRTV